MPPAVSGNHFVASSAGFPHVPFPVHFQKLMFCAQHEKTENLDRLELTAKMWGLSLCNL